MRRLYRLPLGEFTAVRSSLAKQLQKQGDADAANEVKTLPKPSISAWAVNQLFAREAERMRAFLAAGERARKALQHTLTVGDAEALREALQEERGQRDALRDRAAEILSEDLRAPGQAILDRVTVNLDALALSPGAAEDAARGWLSQDLEPPGFEVLAGLQFAARRPDRHGLRLVPPPASTGKKPVQAKPAEKKPAAKAAPAPHRDRAAKKATAEAERRRKADEAAREREEERRRARIERAQEKADRLTAEADTLRRDAERAEREAAEAERAVQEATRRAALAREDADRIRRKADRAAADAERAERDLEAARRLS
jgi:DNA repair exonuclease SbcCD ATPase subunit